LIRKEKKTGKTHTRIKRDIHTHQKRHKQTPKETKAHEPFSVTHEPFSLTHVHHQAKSREIRKRKKGKEPILI